MSKIIIGIIVIVVVLGAVLLGSNKKGGSQKAPQTTKQTQPVKPSVTTQAETTQTQEAAAVAITSSGFTPATITIKVGTKVVWTNKSGGAATVNSALHPTHLVYPPLNLNAVPENESVSLVFDKPGTYKYHDHLNPSRAGTVVVE